jgi:2,4-dienoyl-CoA reductase (NADPH2)
MQTAIAAARRGLTVTVFEALAEPGGQVRLAATVPNRAEFGDLVRNQVRECRDFGVTFELGVTADVGAVLSLSPDAVVVATGSRPETPWWASQAAGTEVADVRDVLEGRVAPAGAVLVVDELGFHQATSVAELLADRGCTVEIATPGMVVGQDLGITLDLEGFTARAAAKSITCSTDRVVMGMGEDGVVLLHHPIGAEERRLVDWVILAVAPAPEDGLYFDLKRACETVPLHRVGDCVAPRRAHAAIIEGDRVGAAL